VNDNINIDNTIVRSVNDNINIDNAIVRSVNDNINMDSTIVRSVSDNIDIDNTICVGHYYTQANTNNVNKVFFQLYVQNLNVGKTYEFYIWYKIIYPGLVGTQRTRYHRGRVFINDFEINLW
jgi:hypothetical protein